MNLLTNFRELTSLHCCHPFHECDIALHLFRLLYPWNISPWRSCTLFIWLNSVSGVDRYYEWHHRLCSFFGWQLLMLKNTIDFCEWILLYLAFLLNSLILHLSVDSVGILIWRKEKNKGKEGRKEGRKKRIKGKLCTFSEVAREKSVIQWAPNSRRNSEENACGSHYDHWLVWFIIIGWSRQICFAFQQSAYSIPPNKYLQLLLAS